jgi:hypothetical protein
MRAYAVLIFAVRKSLGERLSLRDRISCALARRPLTHRYFS